MLTPPPPTALLARRAGGSRAYVAIAGGIDVAPYLGSKATFPGGTMGGHQARATNKCMHACTRLVQVPAGWLAGLGWEATLVRDSLGPPRTLRHSNAR